MSVQQVAYKKFVDRAQDWIHDLLIEKYPDENSLPGWVNYHGFVRDLTDKMFQQLCDNLALGSDVSYVTFYDLHFPLCKDEILDHDFDGDFISSKASKIPDDIIEAWNLYQNSE